MRLLDTNIVSFMLRDDTRIVLYDAHMADHELAISFITLGELHAGGSLAGWGHRRWKDLERLLATTFILHSDRDVCLQYAAVQIARRRQPIPVNDAWIAATALRFGLELVTHNPRDFRNIPGLRVISEVETD